MKRYGNLYQTICTIENLDLAEKKARRGKQYQNGIKIFNLNRTENLTKLLQRLLDKTYRTSPYSTFKVNDGKERTVHSLPYPDRIVHHAIMNILEPIFVNTFTRDTYSCIKRRGIHAASYALSKALRNEEATRYYLQIDIKKFYENINHDILKQLLRKIIKDKDLLELLDGIIDTAPGVPIGNYLSQYFANFYLSYFDHWIKEGKKVQYYFRYADDMIFLAPDKPSLHQLLYDIRQYLDVNLKLTIKGNYRVCPTYIGINFVGYIHFTTHRLLRPSIKKAFARMIARNPNQQSIASYLGWALHCNSGNLIKTLLNAAA